MICSTLVGIATGVELFVYNTVGVLLNCIYSEEVNERKPIQNEHHPVYKPAAMISTNIHFGKFEKAHAVEIL